MTQTAIHYSELREAFDFVSFGQPMENEAYLCLETGKCYWHSEYGDDEEPLPEDIDDAGKYIAIPHKTELDLGKALALRFADRPSATYDSNLQVFWQERNYRAQDDYRAADYNGSPVPTSK